MTELSGNSNNPVKLSADEIVDKQAIGDRNAQWTLLTGTDLAYDEKKGTYSNVSGVKLLDDNSNLSEKREMIGQKQQEASTMNVVITDARKLQESGYLTPEQKQSLDDAVTQAANNIAELRTKIQELTEIAAQVRLEQEGPEAKARAFLKDFFSQKYQLGTTLTEVVGGSDVADEVVHILNSDPSSGGYPLLTMLYKGVNFSGYTFAPTVLERARSYAINQGPSRDAYTSKPSLKADIETKHERANAVLLELQYGVNPQTESKGAQENFFTDKAPEGITAQPRLDILREGADIVIRLRRFDFQYNDEDPSLSLASYVEGDEIRIAASSRIAKLFGDPAAFKDALELVIKPLMEKVQAGVIQSPPKFLTDIKRSETAKRQSLHELYERQLIGEVRRLINSLADLDRDREKNGSVILDAVGASHDLAYVLYSLISTDKNVDKRHSTLHLEEELFLPDRFRGLPLSQEITLLTTANNFLESVDYQEVKIVEHMDDLCAPKPEGIVKALERLVNDEGQMISLVDSDAIALEVNAMFEDKRRDSLQSVVYEMEKLKNRQRHEEILKKVKEAKRQTDELDRKAQAVQIPTEERGALGRVKNADAIKLAQQSKNQLITEAENSRNSARRDIQDPPIPLEGDLKFVIERYQVALSGSDLRVSMSYDTEAKCREGLTEAYKRIRERAIRIPVGNGTGLNLVIAASELLDNVDITQTVDSVQSLHDFSQAQISANVPKLMGKISSELQTVFSQWNNISFDNKNKCPLLEVVGAESTEHFSQDRSGRESPPYWFDLMVAMLNGRLNKEKKLSTPGTDNYYEAKSMIDKQYQAPGEYGSSRLPNEIVDDQDALFAAFQCGQLLAQNRVETPQPNDHPIEKQAKNMAIILSQ